LIGWWWAAWLINNFLSGIDGAMKLSAVDADDHGGEAVFAIFIGIVNIVLSHSRFRSSVVFKKDRTKHTNGWQ